MIKEKNLQVCCEENGDFLVKGDEDSLIHAFDLFYTENKSRGGKNRHMGMGLYLAKKILGIHKINLTIENTSRGIQVSMKRQFS